MGSGAALAAVTDSSIIAATSASPASRSAWASSPVSVTRAREGAGPTLLEMKFTRYFGHFEGDQQTYRADEVEHARAELDCLTRFAARVTETGELTRSDLDAADAEVAATIDRAVDDAKAAPPPTEADLLTDVYVRY